MALKEKSHNPMDIEISGLWFNVECSSTWDIDNGSYTREPSSEIVGFEIEVDSVFDSEGNELPVSAADEFRQEIEDIAVVRMGDDPPF